MEHVLTMANLKLKPFLFTPRPSDHTCYTIKYSVPALVLYDKWNQKLEQMIGTVSRRTVQRWLVQYQTTVFNRLCLFLKYTETGNVLKTIRRFQRQFPYRNVHYCRHSCSNFNHTGHTYCNCPLLFVCTMLSDSETLFETWLFPEHYRFLYTLKVD